MVGSLFSFLCPPMQNIPNLRAFLTFQHKQFSNSPLPLLSALSFSNFWASKCLQWTMRRLQVPLSLSLSCVTFLLLLLLSHHLPLSSSFSLTCQPLRSSFVKGHIWCQHRTNCHSLLFRYVYLARVLSLCYICQPHCTYWNSSDSGGDMFLCPFHSSQRLL